MAARRTISFALVWLAALAVVRVAVAPPEHCAPVTPGASRAAATEAVGWFVRNQQRDGRFVYQYDREVAAVDPGYQVTRHAGVAMSLYEAHAAGISRALTAADRATEWALDRLERRHRWAAVTDQGLAELRTGSTALLVAGLAVRHLATGDDRYDDVMPELGRFLVAMVEPSGAVLEAYDLDADAPVPGRYSVFFTGEAFWALTLLHQVDPGGRWAEPAERVGRYLTTRDRAEDLFPPVSDHWAARGLATLEPPLSDDHLTYLRRLAGIFGLEVRVESQRQGHGVNRLFRPAHASGSGLGTLGEGLGSLWAIAQMSGSIDHETTERIGERLRCGASLLVHRQADLDEAARYEEPARVRGAWFRDGVTRMDDQQHALSALLLAEPALDESGQGGPSGDDDPGRVLWLALVGLAALNPPRLRRSASAGWPVVAALALGLVGAALAAGPVLRAIDVSPPTALVGAGAVLIISAVVDVARPADAESSRLVVLRPAVVLLVAATAADAGTWVGVVIALVVSLVAAASTRSSGASSRAGSRSQKRGLRAGTAMVVAAVAVVGGIDLIADGVFGI